MQLIGYLLTGSIKFLCLRRADRNSLTYEYVKPTAAVKLSQLRKHKWAHALLLGGPLTKEEIQPDFLKWINLNSKSLRKQLELLDSTDQDEEYGLILVLTKFTSPGYTDVRFLNHGGGEELGPVVMGSISGVNGSMKWLRGYPVDGARNAFNGEFVTNEAQPVCSFYFDILMMNRLRMDMRCFWMGTLLRRRLGLGGLWRL